MRTTSLLALVLTACAPSPAPVDAGPDAAPPPDARPPGVDAAPAVLPPPWIEPAAPALDCPITRQAPWLLEANRWRTVYDVAADQPDRLHRGAFGVGNGHVFALVGSGEPDPLTVRELVGPTYDRGEAFFSDLRLGVRVGASPWTPTHMWQWQVRGTAVVVTLARGDGLDLVIVDAAPWSRPSWIGAALPEERAVLRHVAAHATGAPLASVEVALAGRGTFEAQATRLYQARAFGTRLASISALGGGARVEAATREAVLVLGPIAAGAEARGTFALVTARSEAELAETLAALPADPLPLFEATRDAWRAWSGAGTTLLAPEPMVVDLLESMRIQIRVQQAATGATCPMSQYTRTWLRDSYGPVLALLPLGHPDAVRELLDYQYRSILFEGDLVNSTRADRDPAAPAPPTPDFRALGPLTGTARAEGPSHVVLGHDELARWTGERDRVDARFELLRRAVVAQEIRPDGLLPFSGDETYRAAMAVGLGFSLAEQFTTGFLSADSSVLLVVAAEKLAAHALALGRAADAAELSALATRVRDAAERTYWNDTDGFYAPFALEPTLERWAEPFEDVSTKPVWVGYLDPRTPRARRSLRSLWERIGTDRGMLLTWVHPSNAAVARSLGVRFGVYTGMSPGYWLGAAAAADLALAQQAFDALGQTPETGGSWSEYVVYDDGANMSLLYDEEGTTGDRTARYRPWEGGIDVRAVLDWLFGVVPSLAATDAPGDPSLELYPRLPAGWGFAELRAIRVGQHVANVRVEESPAAGSTVRRYTIEHAAGTLPLRTTLRVSVPGTELLGLRIDGAPATPPPTELDPVEARLRLSLAPIAIAAGASLAVEVEYR